MLLGLILLLVVTLVGVQVVSGENGAVSADTPVNGENVLDWVETLTQAGKTVVLDAGHGGEDPGAVSQFSGAKEKDITLVSTDRSAANVILEAAKLIENGR